MGQNDFPKGVAAAKRQLTSITDEWYDGPYYVIVGYSGVFPVKLFVFEDGHIEYGHQIV